MLRTVLYFADIRNIRKYFGKHVGLVHSIDMYIVYAVRDKVDNLLRREGNARLTHRKRLVSEALDDFAEASGHGGTRKRNASAKLARIGYRHNSRNNGDIYALALKFRHKRIHYVVIEEHLRCEKLASAFGFYLQSLDIRRNACRLGMSLGIAGAADAEIALLLYR